MLNRLLQEDYDLVIEVLRVELCWTRVKIVEFTEITNFLLNETEYRNEVIRSITEVAQEIRAGKNEAALAILKARQNV